MSGDGTKTIDHYKKILERFGTFSDGTVPKAGGGGERKDVVQRFADEINRQIQVYDAFTCGVELTQFQLRKKWWFLFGRDDSKYVLIPKWRGAVVDLRDIFGGNYIVDRTKLKPALEILLEMNEKRYFEKRLNEIETEAKAKSSRKTGKSDDDDA